MDQALVCSEMLFTQSCPTLRPHGLSPGRLLCLWDSPGKNTGVVAIPSSRGASQIKPRSPAFQADPLPTESPGKPGAGMVHVKSSQVLCLLS